jgi:two-component system sensor histidine kinase RegB
VEATLCALLDNASQATKAAGSAHPIDVAITKDNGSVVIRVEDSGIGVPMHLRDHLGEPFLTSKDPGEGMGLGLYLLRNLLARVGGQLEVATREPLGTGTRVILRLSQVSA